MLHRIKQLINEWQNYRAFFALKPEQRRLVFYSERDIYYQYYEGYINYILDNSDLDICYLTSDEYDPIFKTRDPRIIPFFIDYFLAATILQLDARVLVMTMPDLNNYHIKRSRNKVNHVYMFHGVGSIHLQYRKAAFIAYDTIMCIGPSDFNELKKEESLYKLKPRELVKCGYYRIEKIYHHYQQLERNSHTDNKLNRRTILIAPSWHNDNILESCINKLISVLKELDFRVIIRPHPEYIKRKKKVVEDLKKYIDNISNIVLELNMVNEASILSADILITDWSAIAFEYAFGTEKPVLFINTPCRVNNPHYHEFKMEPIEFTLRNEVGKSIDPQNISKIRHSLEEFLENKLMYRDRIVKCRSKYLYNWMHSAEIGGRYLIHACKS